MQTETKLIAFHGDQAIKDKYIARVKAHALADEIIKGKYWQDGKGCAVGCTVHSDKHTAYENELGIPVILAKLQDRIFEGMPNNEAKKFPLEFLEAINIGADLSKVWYKFMVWLLSDPKDGVQKYIEKSKPAFDAIINGLMKESQGELLTRSNWIDLKNRVCSEKAAAYVYGAAADAAYAAAACAGDAAAYAAYGAAAAYVYVYGAAAAAYVYAAAAYAADAAAACAGDAVAKEKSFSRQAKKLLELLKSEEKE